jgi:hypothetical protein
MDTYVNARKHGTCRHMVSNEFFGNQPGEYLCAGGYVTPSSTQPMCQCLHLWRVPIRIAHVALLAPHVYVATSATQAPSYSRPLQRLL